MSATVRQFPLSRGQRWTNPADPCVEEINIARCAVPLAEKVDQKVDELIDAAWRRDEEATQAAKEILRNGVLRLLRGSLLEAHDVWARKRHSPS